jgi:hypothetical protein
VGGLLSLALLPVLGIRLVLLCNPRGSSVLKGGNYRKDLRNSSAGVFATLTTRNTIVAELDKES